MAGEYVRSRGARLVAIAFTASKPDGRTSRDVGWTSRFAGRGRESVTQQISLMFALIGSFVMSMYYLRTGFRTGGDESQMADILNIPKSALEVSFALVFLTCLIVALRALKEWRTRLTWLSALLIGSISTGLLPVKADGLIRSQIDFVNPLFRSVLGFSLPVLLVNVAALAGLLVLWQRGKTHVHQVEE